MSQRMTKNAKIFELFEQASGINSDVAKVIIDTVGETIHLEPGGTRDGPDGTDPRRKCLTGFLPTDHWVSGMLAHWINHSNLEGFGFDLDHWADYISYLVYNSNGDKYDWHIDKCESKFKPGFIRKLSVSLCLSSKEDYEGGELELKLNDFTKSYKMDIGDVIVFPSDAAHRITPITSGERISLVGWMGGPKFR